MSTETRNGSPHGIVNVYQGFPPIQALVQTDPKSIDGLVKGGSTNRKLNANTISAGPIVNIAIVYRNNPATKGVVVSEFDAKEGGKIVDVSIVNVGDEADIDIFAWCLPL